MQQLHINTAHFDFTTAQIVINCTLKYALYDTHINTFKHTNRQKYMHACATAHT